ncbi:MAG: FAD-dependent oxidoreductase [Rickettsiales bacterium]|nr:FAD-dependent oxidoreductase [Rickettsiales bacterium]
MGNKIFKIGVIIFLVFILIAFFFLDVDQYITLEWIKIHQYKLLNYYQSNPFFVLVIFSLIYIAVTAFSLPIAAILTLLGGVLFGFSIGVVIISFASSIGATCAFLLARFLFKDYVQKKYGKYLKEINKGFMQEGAFYLFALRLVPIFPFFMVNILVSVTPIKTRVFYLFSQLGMLPGTVLYVYAGTELGKISTIYDITSPKLLLVFALLGLFPITVKKAVDLLREYFVGRYNYNVVVLGGGSAGLVSAYIAAVTKAKVALIEKNKMGGDCLNTGCVPSKSLICSAKILAHAKRAKDFGFEKITVKYNFADIKKRIDKIIRTIKPHDSVERYSKLGVDCIKGKARIITSHKIEIGNKTITTRAIIIATGAEPYVPSILGLDKNDYLTSDSIWNLTKLPKKLLVLGGGPIGIEIAQAFTRLGSSVTLVVRSSQILKREDKEVSDFMVKHLKKEGVTIITNCKIKYFQKNQLIYEKNGKTLTITFNKVLVALGRKPSVVGFGLEKLGVTIRDPQGTVWANQFLQTNIPNIYVCGDVTGPYQFTHTAAYQAWHATINALFSPFKKFKIDYRVVPWTTFTDPEIARVGLNKKTAKEQNIPYEVTIYKINDLDRAITDSEAYGFIEVLTVPCKDKILGVTIVSSHAGDLIAEYVLAMKYNLGLNSILSTIHVYPTFSEANKFVAGQWKKNHIPSLFLKLSKKFHNWRR